jgi:hypothetical protein
MEAALKQQIDQPEADMATTKDPWVSLNTAEQVRGASRVKILLEALDGKIRHQRVAGRRFFHRDDLTALKAADADEAGKQDDAGE